MSGALDGIKVIDVGLLVQGPQAAALLRDMGAEVIKVELPRVGDQARYILLGDTDPRSAYFEACNRGKRGLSLDLRKAEGAEIFKRLIEDTDILISNFQAGTLEEWGLGYEELSAVNPKLVWAAGNTFGPIGDLRLRKGADLAAQCAGGLVSTTGRDGDLPSPVGVTIADHIGSLNMVCGILGALNARSKTGRGQKVEVSLVGGQIWAQAAEYTHCLMTGEVPGRSNLGHPLIHGAYRIYQTEDGWIGLIGLPAHAMDQFLVSVGLSELLVDERIATLGTPEGLEWFLGELEVAFRTKTTTQWCEIFAETEVRYAPVLDYASVVDEPNNWENGYFEEGTDDRGESRRVVGNPIRLSETPLNAALRAPDLGEDTDAILRELGIDEAEITRLRENNVT